MSRIRQTLSNEDGFDLEHVNAKNNPCGLIFELRKKNQGLKKYVFYRIYYDNPLYCKIILEFLFILTIFFRPARPRHFQNDQSTMLCPDR